MKKHQAMALQRTDHKVQTSVSDDLCSVHCYHEFAVKCSLLSPKLMRTKHCRRNCEEMSSKLEINFWQSFASVIQRKEFPFAQSYAKRRWIWDVHVRVETWDNMFWTNLNEELKLPASRPTMNSAPLAHLAGYLRSGRSCLKLKSMRIVCQK